MARKKDKNGGESATMGAEKEMFDTLFREELDVQKKGAQKSEPPGKETRATEGEKEYPPSPLQDELSETVALSTAERRILKIKPGLDDDTDTVKSFEAEEDQELQELIDTSPIWRYRDDTVEEAEPETDCKPVKRSHRLRTSLLALLLLVLGAFYINYFGIFDLREFMPLSEWKPTSVVEHRVVRKPAIPPMAKERPSTRAPTPETPVATPVAPRETPEPETSTAPEMFGEKSVAANEQPEPMPSTPKPTPDETAHETALLKAPARDTQPPKWFEGSHPYSVYLGSYGTTERLRKAVTEYGSVGLSPYWVQVDLGEKGIWFRLFAGSFKTRGEADAFIRENKIEGASSRHTKYAVLIGAYRSEKEISTERLELRDMVYSSYEVKGRGAFGLFSGAFYQMGRAQKHKADLASRGIRGEVVER
jgi:hypothetical protein